MMVTRSVNHNLYCTHGNYFFFHFSHFRRNYVPPPKVSGGHISFSADLERRRRRDKFVAILFLESVGGILPDLHGYIPGTSQRAD